MDNRRLFLVAALLIVAFLIYQAWTQDYGPKPAASTPVAATQAAPAAATVPLPPSLAPALASRAAAVPAISAAPSRAPAGEDVRVRTDLLDVVINTAGGDIRDAQLLKYPLELKHPGELVKVVNSAPAALLALQSGFITRTGATAPEAQALYRVPATQYVLTPGQKTLEVRLSWTSPQGLAVDKVYTFNRGSYQIGLAYTLKNTGSAAWSGSSYAQLENHYVPESHGIFSAQRYDYQRVAVDGNEGYQQFEFKELTEKPLAESAANGWAAIVDHYFLAALIPQGQAGGGKNYYYSKALGDEHFLLGTVSPAQTLAPGASTGFAYRLFLGPKLQTLLPQVAPGLQLTVDYGKFTIIAEPLFKLLNLLHRLVGNWGWAIILLTILVKLVFFPLNQIAGRSMAKMKRVQPRIKALQERYKDDRTRQSQAMMEFYKKEKINPMGGCLPMLVQIPIFFALYYVLVYSVELRQSPWIFWIKDLSAPDPYFILPICYGVFMFIQQHVQPQPTTDKMQARLMKFMPLAFAVFYAVFPSGLALYYVANSIFTIGQQWFINRAIEGDNRRHAEKESRGK